MTSDIELTSPPGRSPDAVDRRYLTICGAVWLLALAAWAVATVALVNLGRGRETGPGGSNTALYIVIGVSALVIIVAIPLLLKARRTAIEAHSAGVPQAPRPDAQRGEGRTEKMRVFGSEVDLATRRQPEAAATGGVVDRVVLRGSAAVFSVMGASSTCVAVATYLLARNWTTASWVALGVAAAVLIAAPVAVVTYQRFLPSHD